ncbi:MAG: hypothetical protein HOP09_14450 [Hyphomicrobium sp.]|nr:hypothetical protein [Hyphomicrobium sp.]
MSSVEPNLGRAWERQIEVWNHTYRSDPKDVRAVVFRVPPPIRMIGSPVGGRFTAAFETFGPPDYSGVTADYAVCFDAKATTLQRWSFDLLDLHQARDLEGWSRMPRTKAFIALKIRDSSWVVDWSGFGPIWWRWNDERRLKRSEAWAASLTPARIREFGFTVARPMSTPGDWLSAL